MENSKRTRGRPKGSGKDDSAVLNAVADLLLRQPSLAPTTAMKRIAQSADPSEIRRLQQKWKVESASFITAASARAAARAQTTAPISKRIGRSFEHGVAAAQRDALGYMDPTYLKELTAAAEGASVRAAREYLDTSTGRYIREMTETATGRLAREMSEPTISQSIRAMLDSGMVRYLREEEELRRRLRGY